MSSDLNFVSKWALNFLASLRFSQISNVCDEYGKNFVAMIPEGTNLSFADKYSLDRVVVGIDSLLINKFFVQLTSTLRAE